jgi:hypothetical protein
MMSIANRRRRKRVWNGIEKLIIKVEEGIEERPFSRKSADRKGNMEH